MVSRWFGPLRVQAGMVRWFCESNIMLPDDSSLCYALCDTFWAYRHLPQVRTWDCATSGDRVCELPWISQFGLKLITPTLTLLYRPFQEWKRQHNNLRPIFIAVWCYQSLRILNKYISPLRGICGDADVSRIDNLIVRWYCQLWMTWSNVLLLRYINGCDNMYWINLAVQPTTFETIFPQVPI